MPATLDTLFCVTAPPVVSVRLPEAVKPPSCNAPVLTIAIFEPVPPNVAIWFVALFSVTAPPAVTLIALPDMSRLPAPISLMFPELNNCNPAILAGLMESEMKRLGLDTALMETESINVVLSPPEFWPKNETLALEVDRLKIDVVTSPKDDVFAGVLMPKFAVPTVARTGLAPYPGRPT